MKAIIPESCLVKYTYYYDVTKANVFAQHTHKHT